MRTLVTGATGLIGRNLVKALESPVVLSRNPENAKRALNVSETYAWEPEAGPPPAEALRGVDVVFHLAGDPVAEGRWTAGKKGRILSSRVLGTRNLVSRLESLEQKPRALISASAVGYYGARGDEVLDENSTAGNDFLAEVCKSWEAEATRAAGFGVRVVTPRIGVVLGPGGGALAKMLAPFKLGLGGRLGSGRHWMSWIHVDDVVGLLLHAAQVKGISGALNAVAPAPVTNREFTRELASALHRPAIFPAPEFALRLALGEVTSVLLASQRVMPRVAEKTGYRFRHATLDRALRAALGQPIPGDKAVA